MLYAINNNGFKQEWFDLHDSLPLFLVKKLYKKGGGYGVYAERDSPIDKIKCFV